MGSRSDREEQKEEKSEAPAPVFQVRLINTSYFPMPPITVHFAVPDTATVR